MDRTGKRNAEKNDNNLPVCEVASISLRRDNVSVRLRRIGFASKDESEVHLNEVRAFANIPSENNATNAGRVHINLPNVSPLDILPDGINIRQL